jgi:hypothetical protein
MAGGPDARFEPCQKGSRLAACVGLRKKNHQRQFLKLYLYKDLQNAARTLPVAAYSLLFL